MIRLSAFLYLLIAFAFSATTAVAQTKLEKVSDSLTVSGRFNLPRATQPLISSIETVTINSAIGKDDTGVKRDLLNEGLLKASNKSLTNYGYITRSDVSDVASNRDISTLKITFDSLDVQSVDNDTQAIVSLIFESPKACLNSKTESKYTSLDIPESEGGKKAFAIVSGIVLSFIDPLSSGSVLLRTTLEINEANHLNVLATGRSFKAVGKGYPPKKGQKAAKREAVTNALRLAIAQYIVDVSTNCSSHD